MIRLADYIASFLADRGIRHVFMVTGGGAMHLNDAFGREKRLRYICNHHEQACAMAAESYARLGGRMAAVNVTTGPGGINAINGVFGAWTDSVPMLVISGQVKRETCMAFHSLPHLRQLGDQEADIISMVRGITKSAEMLREASEIRHHLERAFHLATTGRPGPCWLDIPIDLQGALVDPASLLPYVPDPVPGQPKEKLREVCQSVAEKARTAKRPVILVGGGIRAAGAREHLLKFLDHWHVPVVTAWNAHDVIWNDHPQFAGRPGSIGDRPGNFAVQNSDFLLVLGCRLNVRQISYNWKAFAREAYSVMVDIDAAELEKPTFAPDLPVHADVKDFLEEMLRHDPLGPSKERKAWVRQGIEWREKYPVVLPGYRHDQPGINPYCFFETLFEEVADDQIIVSGDGTACVASFQAANLKRNQRLYTNSGCASMGYDLPGAIGACLAAEGKAVICLAGDGSIQMNLQELQTIATHSLPIKIIILNNGGYHSIRQTQQNFFADNIVGCGLESGLGFPDFQKLASAYGFPYAKADRHSEMRAAIQSTLARAGACVLEIFLDLSQQFAPKSASRRLPDGTMISAPLEDLAPFLPREELRQNMYIAPYPEPHP